MGTKSPAISVIVPIYNVEGCLELTLQSIRAQTFTDYEVILVDDGSSDASGVICDAWSSTDSRFVVFHKENGGLSSARNAGINCARGEYLFFVDGDDLIPPNALKSLFDALIQTSGDVAIGALRKLRPETSFFDNDDCPSFVTMSTEECLEKVMYCDGISMSACGKLYRSTVWQHHRFPEGNYYEDVATIPMVLAECNLICSTESSLYGYVTRVGSITGSAILSEKKYSDAQLEIRKLENFAVSSNIVSKDAIAFFKAFTWLRLYRYIPKDGQYLDNGEIKRLRCWLRAEAAKWKHERKTTRSNRLRLLLFSISPLLYEAAFSLYARKSGLSVV